MMNMKNKKLVNRVVTPMGWVLAALLAVWVVAGCILTFVAIVLGAAATFFLGGIGGWVLGAFGVGLFLILPYFGFSAIFSGVERVGRWSKRDEVAEADAAARAKQELDAFRDGLRQRASFRFR